MVYQIKDVGEVLLKLPILCAAAYLKEVENDDSIAVKMIEKKLSISDWTTICSHLISKYNRQYRYAIPNCLRHILERVNCLCNNSKLVEGRNDYLGHGAMGFDDNAEYRSFSLSLMEGVSKYLDEVFNDYSQIVIKVGDHALKGRFFPDLSEVDVPPVLLLEGKEIPLSPFIVNSSAYGGLFFDYFRTGNTDLSAMGLNYITGGGRKPFVAPYYRELYQREYRNILNSKSEMVNENVDGDTIGIELEKLLDSMNSTDNFIRPDYIIKWIDDVHSDEHGSVCLLMMDRGMGKTSLSYALAEKKISEMNDTFVAAYYCGSSQIQRDYILAINHALATGITERKTGSFILLKKGAPDRRQNMLESLEYFRKQHKEWDHKTKLMLIIDGLDELPQENEDLFDYIPAPENMPDNVYLLLTSRNPVNEPLPEHVTKGLTGIRKNISDVMTVGADESSPNSYNNHTLLKEFVQKKVCLPSGKKPTEDEAESLIGLSGGIFLNLKLYAKLVESGMELHNLPALDSKKLFSMYLGEIRKYYGGKLFDEAMTMLYAIITAQEPLTAHEIAWLFGEEHVTLKQIAFIRDFGALLKTVRTQDGTKYLNERGTLVKPASVRYIKFINEFFPKKKKELRELFIDRLKNTDLNQYKIDDNSYLIPDGLLYMAAYLPDIADTMDDTMDDTMEELIYYINQVYSAEINNNDYYVVNRRANLGTAWGNYCAQKGWETRSLAFFDIASKAYLKQAGILLESGDYERAEALFNISIQITTRCIDKGFDLGINNLTDALFSRGMMFKEKGYYDNALRDVNYCIELLESLHNTGKLYDLNYLATAYMNRGVTYDNIGRYDEALSDYEKCIRIREDLQAKGMLYDSNELAAAYMNRGNTLGNIGRYDEALHDYEDCICIMEKPHRNGELFYTNELASTYMHNSITYFRMNEYEKAIVDLDKCIEIRRELFNHGRLYELGDLAYAMYNKAVILCAGFDDRIGALKICNEGIILLEAQESLSYYAKSVLDKLYQLRVLLSSGFPPFPPSASLNPS